VLPKSILGTPLVTFYEFDNYNGNSNTIYGSAGTCDSSGYGFNDLTANEIAVSGIESYVLWGECNATALWTTPWYGGPDGGFNGDQPSLPAPWADGFYSMEVWHQ
jgi:hypothetical protein